MGSLLATQLQAVMQEGLLETVLVAREVNLNATLCRASAPLPQGGKRRGAEERRAEEKGDQS